MRAIREAWVVVVLALTGCGSSGGEDPDESCAGLPDIDPRLAELAA